MAERRIHSMNFIRRLLELGEKYDDHSFFWWRCGKQYGGGDYDDPASFFTNCNDLFAWGCADGEDITPENIDELERSFADCEAAVKFGHLHGTDLFACRMRKMRPQGAAYPKKPELWPLFDACGPERETGMGNPHPHPRKKAEASLTTGVT